MIIENKVIFLLRTLVLIVVLILVLIGLNLRDYYLRMILFLLSGIVEGVYFGLSDYRIYHYPHTDDFYKNYFQYLPQPNKELNIKPKIILKNIPPFNDAALVNILWVHVVCGIVGALSLFYGFRLLTYHRFNLQLLFLSLIAVLGYTGLLPRTLWFLASKGGLGDIKS